MKEIHRYFEKRKVVLRLSSFPGRERGTQQSSADSDNQSTSELESTPLPPELEKLLVSGEGKDTRLYWKGITRDTVLHSNPRRYAFSPSELNRLEQAIKALDRKTVEEMLDVHKQRAKPGSCYDGLWYEPYRSDLDVIARYKLARSLIKLFGLFETNLEPHAARFFDLIPRSRIEAFIKVNGETRLEEIKQLSAIEYEHVLEAFAHIIWRYAIGDFVYSLNGLDRRIVKLWDELAKEKNICKLKLFLSIFMLPFLSSILIVDGPRCARILNLTVSRIEDLFTALPDIDMVKCTALNRAIQRTWRFENPPSFCLLLQFYLGCDPRVINTPNSKNLEQHLSEIYGQNVNSIVATLQKGKLHRFSSDIADQIMEQLGIEFVHAFFYEMGLIIDEEEVLFSHSSVQLPYCEGDDLVPKEMLEYKWSGDFAADYADYRRMTKEGGRYESMINKWSEHYLQKIGKNGIGKPSLSKRLLKLKWPQIMRDIVLCRIVLALSEAFPTVSGLARMLGNTNAEDREGKRGGLEKTLSEMGITDEIRQNPREFRVIGNEDLKWIEEHRAVRR